MLRQRNKLSNRLWSIEGRKRCPLPPFFFSGRENAPENYFAISACFALVMMSGGVA